MPLRTLVQALSPRGTFSIRIFSGLVHERHLLHRCVPKIGDHLPELHVISYPLRPLRRCGPDRQRLYLRSTEKLKQGPADRRPPTICEDALCLLTAPAVATKGEPSHLP